MKILLVHNYYQQWGGEDECAEQEHRLLEQYGHTVHYYTRHNDEIEAFSMLRKGALFFEPSWSRRTYRELKQIINDFKPDVVHFHNYFPLVSPSAFWACADAGVPSVLTLHDYRLMCPIGWFFRDGEICEDCLDHSLLSGIRHSCYHGSAAQTSSVALMIQTHRTLGTWQKKVNAIIALNNFSRDKFVQGGLPADKFHIRPNFLEADPGIGGEEREFALFVGRMSREKGLDVLLKAWRNLPDVPLKILGGGPLKEWAADYIAEHNMTHVELVGFVQPQDVLDYQKRAMFLVLPSIWYEVMPRVLIEAYAAATPVIATRLGSMAELVQENHTGLLFERGDAESLAAQVREAVSDMARLRGWGRNSRHEYESRLTADAAHDRLLEIYNAVIEGAAD